MVSVMVTQRAVDCNRPGVHFRSAEQRLRQKALREEGFFIHRFCK